MRDAALVPKVRRKSVLVSGLLSFFLGPLGFLYAAPLREAVPASVVWLLLGALLPHFVLVWVAGLVCPLSAVAGVLYAWSYNRTGERLPLLAQESARVKRLNRQEGA